MICPEASSCGRDANLKSSSGESFRNKSRKRLERERAGCLEVEDAILPLRGQV